MKTNTKEIKILIVLLTIIMIGALIQKNIQNNAMWEIKKNMLLEEIENNKITDEEKTILKINSENIKTKTEIKKIDTEIKILDEDKTEKEIYEECLKIQLIRIWEWKEVLDWYCENKNTEIVPKTTKIEAMSVPKVKKDALQVKTKIYIKKSNLFMCLEVKEQFWFESDEFRCWSYMTMVKYFESNDWKSNYCKNYNNCYWLKNPTDKNWLKWKYSVWTWRFLKFETSEMWDYAFAYYYLKYHNTKNASQFVNTYSDWNKNYIYFLINNYEALYTEYENLLK